MRKLFVIASLLLHLSAFSQTSENNYFAKEQKAEVFFHSLDLEPYIGKKAGVFLQQISEGTLTKELLTDAGNKGYAGLMRLSYPDGLLVDVYVKVFQYTNPYGISRRKNLRQFEKETIAGIRIHNGLACLNGCD